MAAPTVFQDIAEGFDLDGVGQLFAGKKFWVAQRVPSRNRLLDDIKANGGEIVALEKKADYRIADHFRKDCPPGSISYEFVEKSIQQGQICDPDDHRAGPLLGEAREPGAISRPAKGGRAAYSADEDRLLYKWVRDCEAAGGQASGNEIYKQLEAKYPRHTWQSWRDRYLKQLRNRPPSALNIPDNVPPSPLSNTPGKTASEPSYTVDQLASTFDSEDWDELYAFVDLIDEMKGKAEYNAAWVQWAKTQDNQTAEQWRQYYEKVVRPQWLRDPEWKRKQIKEKVEKKHDENPSGSQSILEQHQEKSLETNEETPSKFTANTAKEVISSVQNLSNSEYKQAEQIPEGRRTEAPKAVLEVELVSSSSAHCEPPKYIPELRQKTLKRVRGEDDIETVADREQPRLPKRQKSTSPMIEPEAPQETSVGSQQLPLEILSSHDSTTSSQIQIDEQQTREHIMQDIELTQQRSENLFMHNLKESYQEILSINSDDFPDINGLQPPPKRDSLSEDELPSNTPTPRATLQKINNFDTQAILSTPSQGIGINRLPRPVGYTQDLEPNTVFRSSSAIPHPESDASTTQSLQDFRRSLNDEDLTQVSYPTLRPLSRPISPSPAPSDFSTSSGDPDVPLDASEFDEFYTAQHAEGFDDEFITKALKRTRCRPGLAELVLEAWREGKPLPNQRGIWSWEDDEAAESGDGFALAKLERKHTLDGWGGLTERMKFLDSYRSRQLAR